MSITTPSGEPRKPGDKLPSKASTGEPGTSSAADAPKASAAPKRSAGAPKKGAQRPPAKPAGKGAKGAKGKSFAPVKVNQQKNWGSIAMFTIVGLIVVGIIGYGTVQAIQGSKTWEEKARGIDGIVDWHKTNEKELAAGNGNHVQGLVKYFATPSVGGNHNGIWQNCMGDVYPQQIASEHATHSMEHGAVWVTYDPASVSPDDIKKLTSKVQGNEYTLLSPFPNQGSPISLQAWGWQLKVNSASDSRIDDFIKALRKNASVEPGAVCSGGTTATGTTPQGGADPQTPVPSAAPSGTPAPSATP
ncbi:hypothetical protein Lfu02_53040 [Longispora fulva]|uniref:DUF3105 domain-containing protein n=1 Tax=Longispora fulva TaxID=619741 RepID=A0A8J7GXD1_9ACTN|nr:DUF3105 domain-containing protein [Longispora fulva]MBG6140804.1 hypothetical protein [Longispora fulva]GIG60932.1 hypothetical protein Lfu02_53040 [Longispora fulva]